MKNRHDHYFKKAKAERYASRAAYKLQEIQTKHRVLRRGTAVLDLGCRPGSWMQVAAQEVGSNGTVVGIDRKPLDIDLPAHCHALAMDVFELDEAKLRGYADRYRTVLSDMAPDTTGTKFVDQMRSINLCEAALDVARRVLEPGGDFVTKIFQGPGFEDFLKDVRSSFQKASIMKPKSSRKESKEIYLVAKGFKG